jgi:predicted neutral ceramidase superfamily lipid hydrolase
MKVLFKNLGSPPSGIGDLSWSWRSYLGPLVYLLAIFFLIIWGNSFQRQNYKMSLKQRSLNWINYMQVKKILFTNVFFSWSLCLLNMFPSMVFPKHFYFSYLGPLVYLLAIFFLIIWLSNLSILSVPDEGYSRNALCALNLISTFYYFSRSLHFEKCNRNSIIHNNIKHRNEDVEGSPLTAN